jgi:hypothetical protein
MIAPVRILRDALKSAEDREVMYRREDQHKEADKEMREVLEIRGAVRVIEEWPVLSEMLRRLHAKLF